MHQIEYALEAVKQGSAVVGIKSKHFAVLAAIKRSFHDLASFQQKIYEIDDHIGVGIAGLTADARELNAYLQNECLQHRYAYKTGIAVPRLVANMGNMMQIHTQQEDKRPYGVGLLLIGYDYSEAHLYQIDPSSNYYECKAMAIGARSQSARTYLDRHLDDFKNTENAPELVIHALRALRDTLGNEEDLSMDNVQVAVVGRQQPFKMLKAAELKPFLDTVLAEQRKRKVRVDPDMPPEPDNDRPPPEPLQPDVDVATAAAEHGPGDDVHMG